MKKIIAGLLAFTLTACTFAGCQKNEQKKSENISANKTDDVTEEKAEAEELSEDGDYETALKEFADAYAENDRQKTLLMQNPKDIMVLVRALVREEGQTEDDIINTMQSDLYETVNNHRRINDVADDFAKEFPFESDETEFKFIELYMEMSHECRIRDNRGHDHYEMVAIMAGAKDKPQVKRAKIGRNDPCPCGSGKKYKNCCGRN